MGSDTLRWRSAAVLAVSLAATVAANVGALGLWRAYRLQPPERVVYQPPVVAPRMPVPADSSTSADGCLLSLHDKPRPPRPVVAAGIQVSGRLPPQVVERMIRRHFGFFMICQETTHASGSHFSGVATVRFIIDRTGATAGRPVASSNLKDEAFLKCLENGFSLISYPSPDSGEVTVHYALRFNATR